MNLSMEVRSSLRILGLSPGATPADVRSAFRRLARTCHPDVTGRSGSVRFEEITGAYTLLKGLSPDELMSVYGTNGPSSARQEKRKRGGFLDWYLRRRARARAAARERVRATQAAQRQAEERETLLRTERIEQVLKQYESRIDKRLSRMEKNADDDRVRDILARLRSSVAGVRRLALGRLGSLANREDILAALTELLCRWEPDDRTARLVMGLPLKPDRLQRLAGSLVKRAPALPNFLIAHLLGLRSFDPEVKPKIEMMERYIAFADKGGIATILRAWPADSVPSDTTWHRLLDSREDEILILALSTMKQRFPEIAFRFRHRLLELEKHPTVAVRVWSRSLLAS